MNGRKIDKTDQRRYEVWITIVSKVTLDPTIAKENSSLYLFCFSRSNEILGGKEEEHLKPSEQIERNLYN